MNWVVSDIHGCFLTLEKLLHRVRTADEHAQFVFVGDYVDRGFKNKEVVDLMIQLQQQGAVCLRGNHDNVIDWLLNDKCLGNLKEYVRGRVCYDSVMNWWMWNGLEPTLVSYKVPPYPISIGPYGAKSWEDTVMRFRENVPQDHKDFFRNLPLFWECDTHFACHAFFKPEQELPRRLSHFAQTEELVHYTLWERFRPDLLTKNFKPPSVIKWDKIGVFGHTPIQSYNAVAPIKYDKIRLIDCGPMMNGYLCAYCCETDNWILQSVIKEDTVSS